MPKRICKHDGSVFFFTSNISKLGSAPTRLAEILWTGIPVLTNLGVGDVEQILANNKVGILIYPSDNLAKKCDHFINLIKNKAVSKILEKLLKFCFL